MQAELEEAKSVQPAAADCSAKDAQLSVLSKQADLLSSQLASCRLELAQAKKGAGSPTASPTPTPAPTGFVGREITVSKGQSFTSADGSFVLSYVGVEPSGLTRFDIGSVRYTRSVGDFVSLTLANGRKYTLNLRSAGDAAVFYLYDG